MPNSSRLHLILGSVVVVSSLILVLVWIPLDVTTGIIERIRRQTVIGDALAPTIAGVFLLIGGLLLVLVERNAPDQPRIDMINLKFVALVSAILATGFLIMRYAGPAAVEITNAFTGGEREYRLLRATVPWKYIGFFLGGGFSVAGVIALVQGRLGVRALVIAVCAMLAMIAIYDLPFDDLLLPPNGDF